MNNDIPNTLRAVESAPNTGRPRIDDPALRHFRQSVVLGDFVSASSHERLEWELVRSEVRTHLLELVSQSRWKQHLVLRGSTLMQAWFGEAARDPKDIDWVFQPQTVKLKDSLCKQCLTELVELAKENPRTQNAQILTEQITMDSIWEYDRAEGRRILFPFQSDKGGQREIYVDIVWGEELFIEPILTALRNNDGREVTVWSATPELSLAWKLLWLATDSDSQGKDLYDAVLLSENTRLPFELLKRVLMSSEWFDARDLKLDLFEDEATDWQNFQLEFPWVQGEEKQWRERLIRALAPTFADAK